MFSVVLKSWLCHCMWARKVVLDQHYDMNIMILHDRIWYERITCTDISRNYLSALEAAAAERRWGEGEDEKMRTTNCGDRGGKVTQLAAVNWLTYTAKLLLKRANGRRHQWRRRAAVVLRGRSKWQLYSRNAALHLKPSLICTKWRD